MVSKLLEARADIEARNDVSLWLLHSYVIMAVMRNKKFSYVVYHNNYSTLADIIITNTSSYSYLITYSIPLWCTFSTN